MYDQLVLVNVSDHYTRCKLRDINEFVVGALFGMVQGESIQVVDSFEMVVIDSPQFQFDAIFLAKKMEQYKAVFPAYELVGWYTPATDAESHHVLIHQAFFQFNSNALVMLVNPNISDDDKELPVKFFEAVRHQDASSMSFVDLPFRLDTVESERLSIDHVVKSGSHASSSVTHVGNLRSSCEMLVKRMRLLESYLILCKSGEISWNHDVLRAIAAICHDLPEMKSLHFENELRQELDDTKLITYLASMTKGLDLLGRTINKASSAQHADDK